MATPKRLILASGSEGRRDLLRKAGYQFDIITSNIEEPTGEGVTNPREFVHHVAWMKAEAVSRRVDQGVILAADSVGWHAGKIIGKPADANDARRILGQLSGTTHELWTGVCLWHRPSDRQICWQEKSVVRMKILAGKELEEYIASGIWEGKSGAYAIQEENDPFVQLVQGSMSNVVGLPLETLAQVLPLAEQFQLPSDKAKDL